MAERRRAAGGHRHDDAGSNEPGHNAAGSIAACAAGHDAAGQAISHKRGAKDQAASLRFAFLRAAGAGGLRLVIPAKAGVSRPQAGIVPSNSRF